MTETARLLLACSAFWVALGLLYGHIAYRAGWRAGYSEAIDYARKHIGLLAGLTGTKGK